MSSLRELTWKAQGIGFNKLADEVKKVDSEVDKTKSSLSTLDSKLHTVGNRMQTQGKAVNTFGKKWMKVTAPLLAVGVAGTKMAMDLDKATRQVSTLTTNSVLPLEKIKKEVKAISHETGIAQTEVANAMYQALSSGVDESKVVNFTKSAYKLTEAGFTDMATAIDATTTVLNAYGEKAFEVSKIHDIMVKTQDEGKITVNELGQNIGRVIPVASSLGVNIDQLGAAYAMLTKKGQNSQMATTNLNAMLSELGKSGTKADKALRSGVGKSFKELTEEGKSVADILSILDAQAKASGESLNDMFGSIQAGSGALTILSSGTEEYNATLEKMRNSDGTATKNAEKMMGDAKKFKMAVNDMKIAMIDIGASLAPFISKFAGVISTLANKFSSLSPSTQQTIAEWGLLIVALGPLIAILGNVITVGGVLLSGLGTVIGVLGSVISVVGGIATTVGSVLIPVLSTVSLPFVVIISAVGAVIAIGTNLIIHWNEVKAKAQDLGGGIKGYLLASIKVTAEGFGRLKDKAVGALQAIKDKWEAVKNFLAHPIQGTISFLQGGSVPSAKSNKPQKVNGSHATGLNTVPFDNYIGNLHQGEMVLPASTAERYRSLGGDIHSIPTVNNSSSSSNFAPVINVTVNGNADERTATDIGTTVRNEIEDLFRELRLQRV